MKEGRAWCLFSLPAFYQGWKRAGARAEGLQTAGENSDQRQSKQKRTYKNIANRISPCNNVRICYNHIENGSTAKLT